MANGARIYLPNDVLACMQEHILVPERKYSFTQHEPGQRHKYFQVPVAMCQGITIYEVMPPRSFVALHPCWRIENFLALRILEASAHITW